MSTSEPVVAEACCAACASSDDTALAIACSLESSDFKSRVEAIRGLSARSLLHSERGPLTLHLIYAPQARAEVDALVEREKACCSFLDFSINQDGVEVHVTIVAPIEALAAADELFAHFAPGLARQAA